MTDALGTGEQLERAQRNRRVLINAAIAGIGLVTGFALGMRDGGNPFSATRWPAEMSIAIAIGYLIAIVGGGIALARHTDEFGRLGQYKAAAVAALTYMIIYPVWFVLWMGALAPEPMHAVLFLLFWAGLMLASLYYRFR